MENIHHFLRNNGRRGYILSIAAILVWTGVIFAMSLDSKSTAKSSAIAKAVVQIAKTVPALKTADHNALSKKVDFILRKLAHFFVYAVLAALWLNFFIRYRDGTTAEKVISALLLAFATACADELLQYYVDGRSGKFSDSIIDLVGGTAGCAAHRIAALKYKNRKPCCTRQKSFSKGE